MLTGGRRQRRSNSLLSAASSLVLMQECSVSVRSMCNNRSGRSAHDEQASKRRALMLRSLPSTVIATLGRVGGGLEQRTGQSRQQ